MKSKFTFLVYCSCKLMIGPDSCELGGLRALFLSFVSQPGFKIIIMLVMLSDGTL